MQPLQRASSDPQGCHCVPLGELKAGQSGCIGEIAGSCALVHRLREMGLRKGVKVRMIRSGSPCIFRLEGHKLCVRAEEVSGVRVQVGSLA